MSPLISESKESLPILIVDKIGDIGWALAQKLSENSTIVLATGRTIPESERIIHVSYRRNIPKIPDNLYSHIFVIDDGEDLTLEALPSFFKKAEHDRAVFSFATNLSRKNLPSEISEYKKSRILYLGDIFPKTGFFPDSYVNKFLANARQRGRIDIPQDGMTIAYPVFLDDAIEGILEASFGTSAQKSYYIFSKHGITLLSLAHSIQKRNPDIKIDFINEDPIEPPKITQEGKFVFEDYPIEERIRSLDISSSKFVPRKNGAREKADKAQFPRLVAFSFLFFLFLPLITTLFFASLGFFFLESSRFSFESSNTPTSLAKKSFILAETFSKPLLYEASLVGIDSSKLSETISGGKKEAEDVQGYYEGVNLIGKGKVNEGISRIKDFLVFAQTSGKFKTLEKETFNFITQTINVWPQILAVDSSKSYLIIFQNDEKERGYGGEVVIFGILTLENGKISEFKTYNAKEADKDLKGHVEPPFAVRRYLSSTDFHLMDAGFDADFFQVAKSASFFVELETGNKTDGVFRIGSTALRKIIGGEAKGTISDQTNLIEKILADKNLAKIFLTKDYVELVEKKEISFFFNDQSLNSVFDAKQKGRVGINDTLGLYETEVKGPDVAKKLSQKVILAEGEVQSIITLKLENTGQEDSTRYVRFIVNNGARLTKILVDRKETDFTSAITDPALYEGRGFVPPRLLEVETVSFGDKVVFGLLSEIPKGQSKEIELTLSYPSDALVNLSSFAYSVHFIKQPGAGAFPYEFSISFPPNYKIYSEPKVSKTVDRDFDLSFNFTK